MKFRSMLLAGALLAPFAASHARAQATPLPINNAAEARQRFRAEAMREAMLLMGDWRTAWESHDARALARQYDRNALLILPGSTAPLQGRAAIEEALRTQLPRLGSIQLQLVDSEVGDGMLYLFQAFTIGPSPDPVTGATPAANVTLKGNTTILLERDAGGGYKIRAQTFQLEPVAAAPDAPRQAASDATD